MSKIYNPRTLRTPYTFLICGIAIPFFTIFVFYTIRDSSTDAKNIIDVFNLAVVDLTLLSISAFIIGHHSVSLRQVLSQRMIFSHHIYKNFIITRHYIIKFLYVLMPILLSDLLINYLIFGTIIYQQKENPTLLEIIKHNIDAFLMVFSVATYFIITGVEFIKDHELKLAKICFLAINFEKSTFIEKIKFLTLGIYHYNNHLFKKIKFKIKNLDYIHSNILLSEKTLDETIKMISSKINEDNIMSGAVYLSTFHKNDDALFVQYSYKITIKELIPILAAAISTGILIFNFIRSLLITL